MAKIIEGLRHKFPLSELLQHAKMSRSTFYYHLKILNNPDKYEDLKIKIKEIFEQNKGYYGYRRVHVILRNQGYNYNPCCGTYAGTTGGYGWGAALWIVLFILLVIIIGAGWSWNNNAN